MNSKANHRTYTTDPDVDVPQENLGPLAALRGRWEAEGTGWNMIALPFGNGQFNYRVLMNQYSEILEFTSVDDNVPNRGITLDAESKVFDQRVATLDYQQQVKQVASEDFPESGEAGGPGLDIHHEPGLWLHMKNRRTNGIDIARLGSVPHGDSLLALGESDEVKGAPTIPVLDGLPIGVSNDVNANPYLSPYRHFVDKPFLGNLEDREPPGFPGFHPLDLNAILRFAAEVTPGIVRKTTTLHVDTDLEDAGVVNIPFIVAQANATKMESTFWIQEIDVDGKTEYRLQYSQLVMLDFFPRRDGVPGLIRWPHVSIATLTKQ